MSDSHTAFHSGSFTAGAVGGALAIASGMVGGLQAVARANREACARYTRNQLEEAYNLSELLRYDANEENAKLRADNDKLRTVIKSMTVRPAPRTR